MYMQVRGQGKFYSSLRNRGLFINAPDDYFFQGTNKEGIGYNENQFSLPRAQQLVITRTTLYENTFVMPPTAGWSFVPLVAYHAGGGAASFWPPSSHLQEYELAIAMHMGFGIAACYRGTKARFPVPLAPSSFFSFFLYPFSRYLKLVEQACCIIYADVRLFSF